MQEAPYSANVRCLDADGFDWQITVRAVPCSDEEAANFFKRIPLATEWLIKNGYKPHSLPAIRKAVYPEKTTPAPEDAKPAHWCTEHGCAFEKRTKGDEFWWSHRTADNKWCNEKKAKE